MRQIKDMRIEKIIAHNLRVLREVHKMSVIKLAAQCGVTRQTIYNIENETHMPNPDLALAISKTFKIEMHELYQIDPKLR